MNEQDEILTTLFHQYGASIHRMCFLYLKDYHLAEDATSETFLRAYRALPSFRKDAAPKTWLMRIAINVCKSRLRSSSFREQTLECIPEQASRTYTPEKVSEVTDGIILEIESGAFLPDTISIIRLSSDKSRLSWTIPEPLTAPETGIYYLYYINYSAGKIYIEGGNIE